MFFLNAFVHGRCQYATTTVRSYPVLAGKVRRVCDQLHKAFTSWGGLRSMHVALKRFDED